jgi:nitrite reductase/ring-hydroxylating ferredoxin subunit
VAKYVIGKVDEIPDGCRRIVNVGGREIGVFNVSGNYYALRNRCPHQGGPLCRGQQLGSLSAPKPGKYIFDPNRMTLRCPWHQWEFDLETGRSWYDPDSVRTRTYKTEVASGSELPAPSHQGEFRPMPGLADKVTNQLGSVLRSDEHRNLAKQAGPYVAETYSVSVEDDYLIIDTGR